MMSNSKAEEDYLKVIYKLSNLNQNNVSAKSISDNLNVKPPTVSNMLQKLKEKSLIQYTKYKGVSLTRSGEVIALKIVRKHRLWETFLVEILKFDWDEVHEIAEQLEHIKSPELINRLDNHLNYPAFDPHGDPIPDKNGVIKERKVRTLSDVDLYENVTMVGVKEHSSDFLQYLDNIKLSLGTNITVNEIISYDKSVMVSTKNKSEILITHQVAKNILVGE